MLTLAAGLPPDKTNERAKLVVRASIQKACKDDRLQLIDHFPERGFVFGRSRGYGFVLRAQRETTDSKIRATVRADFSGGSHFTGR